jgi:hypothetical protein
MLISPLDWALVESWKEMGIPLHIVLRGIIKSFEGYTPETNRGKRVNTLFYCQQEVISNFKDYVESQVGSDGSAKNGGSNGNGKNGSKTAATIFPKQELIAYVDGCRAELEQARARAFEQGLIDLPEALWRAMARLSEISKQLATSATIYTEGLERDLTLLEEMIYESLLRDISPSDLEAIRSEAEQQMRPHKKRMETEVYRQTLENYVAKRLREIHFIPRLSLFYML